VYHCLDEYRQGYQQDLEFSGDWYRDIYESILDLIAEINQNEYHEHKWEQARRAWAREGM
jgi:hypothetical protein